jgi:hypothetical protein
MEDLNEIPKKQRIAAAWNIDRDFIQKRAAPALDVSTEYIRQIKNDIESESFEKITQSEFERAKSFEVQQPVYRALQEHNAFRGVPKFDDQGTIEVSTEELEKEVSRLSVLEQSAEEGGDSERAYVARTAREFLQSQLDRARYDGEGEM